MACIEGSLVGLTLSGCKLMGMQYHYFFPLSGFLGPVCCDLAGGGLGITPACPNNRATGAEG